MGQQAGLRQHIDVHGAARRPVQRGFDRLIGAKQRVLDRNPRTPGPLKVEHVVELRVPALRIARRQAQIYRRLVFACRLRVAQMDLGQPEAVGGERGGARGMRVLVHPIQGEFARRRSAVRIAGRDKIVAFAVVSAQLAQVDVHRVAGQAHGEIAGLAAARRGVGYQGPVGDVLEAGVVLLEKLLEVGLHIEVEPRVPLGIERRAPLDAIRLVKLAGPRIPARRSGADNPH